MFAEIVVNKKNSQLDKLFTYIIPEELQAEISIGSLVRVPFGGEKLLGMIVSLKDKTELLKLRPIKDVVVSNMLTEELIKLGQFTAERFLAPLAAVLFSMAGFGTKIKKPERLKRLPVKEQDVVKWPELVSAQLDVLQQISEQPGGRFLLHGVTGSGKTEVYLQLFKKAFDEGKQALLLVPEIALTPQLTNIFAERFGPKIQVLHSKLSDGERLLVWQKAMQGEIQGIIGARSAIFAPFQRLGVIIMDEEHEYSFKQENVPRFHTRVLAAWRAKYHNATLLYGSATPALESYYAALSKKLTLLSMPERIAAKPMPEVKIVDLRNEIKAGNHTIFSRLLIEKMTDRLQKKEQTILFLNRRGYSAFVSCRECGEVMYCPHCAVTLTYHRGLKAMRCHYCDYSSPVPAACPHCGANNFRRFGIGTERVEEEIQAIFPQAKIVRMDIDTTSKKEAHAQIYATLKSGVADILIGTQMVTKGLDLPLVTLVGVIDADISLFMPDFRAREKTFQLLTQVAGRAGRGNIPGEVIFQTFNPEDFTLKTAAIQDYRKFCENELYKRKVLAYPPYASMLRLVLTSEDSVTVEEASNMLAELLAKSMDSATQILGPAPAPISRLRGKYRWHLHLKGPKLQVVLKGVREAVAKTEIKFKKANIIIHIDVEPYSAL